MKDFVVEAPPQDQAFIIFDPDKTDIEKIQTVIKEAGFSVKEFEEKALKRS